jgi:hypothetical protein
MFGLFSPEVDVLFPLDDIGLFRSRRGKEQESQYERAVKIQKAFGQCMSDSLRNKDCIMSQLCAHDEPVLHCVHLRLDWLEFIQGGIAMPPDRRIRIESRLRGLGTKMYRIENGIPDNSPLPGDRHIAALDPIRHFTGKRKAASQAKAQGGGFLDWLFG